VLEPVDALAQRVYVSLDAEQRADTCVSYDHPLRQYQIAGSPAVVAKFSGLSYRISVTKTSDTESETSGLAGSTFTQSQAPTISSPVIGINGAL